MEKDQQAYSVRHSSASSSRGPKPDREREKGRESIKKSSRNTSSSPPLPPQPPTKRRKHG
jgi:hypothetical protein